MPANKGQRRKRTGPAAMQHGAGGAQWLFGVHPVRAALANPQRRCQRLLITGDEALARIDATAAAPVTERLDKAAIARLLPAGAVHQGVALLAEALPAVAMAALCDDVAADAAALVIVLDQVTDPHNVGAILRSAAAFGAAAVVMQDRHAPPSGGVLAKAASGAMEYVPLVRVANLSRAVEALKAAGCWALGLDAAAPTTLAEARAEGRNALVLGAEGAGLRRLVRAGCDQLARIPIDGAVESLNVSNAAAVALYELRRGRAAQPTAGR